MLDSIYHMTFPENLLTTSGLLILMHGIISLQDATSYDTKTLMHYGDCYTCPCKWPRKANFDYFLLRLHMWFRYSKELSHS